jgi:hypothetical protein
VRVFDWPDNGKLRVPITDKDVGKVTLLSDGKQGPLLFKIGRDGLLIQGLLTRQTM